MSEFDDSQLLMTFDATATRFFGELYEDTQYLRLSDFPWTSSVTKEAASERS